MQTTRGVRRRGSRDARRGCRGRTSAVEPWPGARGGRCEANEGRGGTALTEATTGRGGEEEGGAVWRRRGRGALVTRLWQYASRLDRTRTGKHQAGSSRAEAESRARELPRRTHSVPPLSARTRGPKQPSCATSGTCLRDAAQKDTHTERDSLDNSSAGGHGRCAALRSETGSSDATAGRRARSFGSIALDRLDGVAAGGSCSSAWVMAHGKEHGRNRNAPAVLADVGKEVGVRVARCTSRGVEGVSICARPSSCGSFQHALMPTKRRADSLVSRKTSSLSTSDTTLSLSAGCGPVSVHVSSKGTTSANVQRSQRCGLRWSRW